MTIPGMMHSGVKGMKWKVSNNGANDRMVAKSAKIDNWYKQNLAKASKDPQDKAILDAEYNLRTAATPEAKQIVKLAYQTALKQKGKPPIKNEAQAVVEAVKPTPIFKKAVAVVEDILGKKYGQVSFAGGPYAFRRT